MNMLSMGHGVLPAFRHQGERWGSLALTATYGLSPKEDALTKTQRHEEEKRDKKP
jgi:hypothetical protein